MNLVAAYPLAGTENVLGVDFYLGCRDCGAPPTVRLHFFDAAGWEQWKEFLWGPFGEPLHFGPYGGGSSAESPHGLNIPLAGQGELAKAAREDEDLQEVEPGEYTTLADLFSGDLAGTLIREALLRREKPWI